LIVYFTDRDLIVGAVPHVELARGFVATLPQVERFVAAHQPPFIAKVYRPAAVDGRARVAAGRVELWYPRK
jgi:hypothetical protein